MTNTDAISHEVFEDMATILWNFFGNEPIQLQDAEWAQDKWEAFTTWEDFGSEFDGKLL